METAEIIAGLEFEPKNRFMSCGNEIQICEAVYEKVHIMWRTFFPWNIFKEPTDTFVADLILPMDTKVANGWMDTIYEPEGFGSPHFRELKDVIEFIKSYNHGKQKI